MHVSFCACRWRGEIVNGRIPDTFGKVRQFWSLGERDLSAQRPGASLRRTYIARGRISATAIHPNDRWSITSSTKPPSGIISSTE